MYYALCVLYLSFSGRGLAFKGLKLNFKIAPNWSKHLYIWFGHYAIKNSCILFLFIFILQKFTLLKTIESEGKLKNNMEQHLCY